MILAWASPFKRLKITYICKISFKHIFQSSEIITGEVVASHRHGCPAAYWKKLEAPACPLISKFSTINL